VFLSFTEPKLSGVGFELPFAPFNGHISQRRLMLLCVHTSLHFLVGTHVAGTIAGKPYQGASPVGNGVAEDAKLAVFDFAIAASGGFDPGVDRLFTSLYRNGNGAKVINGSWGRRGSGVYSAECRDMDDALALYEDILYVASAGNIGSWRTINSPADCKSTMAVGASLNQNGAGRDRLISYSSKGPTADGRIKPDVVAPGFYIRSSAGGQCGVGQMDGTSMSAPGVSEMFLVLSFESFLSVEETNNPFLWQLIS